MRFNPRAISYNGPFNKETDRHEWRTGGVVGLTVTDWISILDAALEYRTTSSKHPSPDEGSYTAQQIALIEKVKSWIAEGPKPFDKTKQGLYRSRGEEVVLLLDGYHEISGLFTQTSLRLHDLVEKNKGDDFDIMEPRESARKILTPSQFHALVVHEDAEKVIKIANEKDYDDLGTPIIQRSAYVIKRRREKLLSDRRFRVRMDNIFAEMAAKRKGEEFTPKPEPVRTPPAKPVYVKPEQRPTGPAYDLPTPKVKIGDKLRPAVGRGPEIAYYKKQLVRQQMKNLRRLYKEWAVTNPERFGKPMKITDGNKDNIREMIRVIENAYEVEVAGITARPSQPYVANQCYVGGGSGWSGLSYSCVLLFRAEQPSKQTEGAMNQVAYLMHEFPLADYHAERYVMGE